MGSSPLSCWLPNSQNRLARRQARRLVRPIFRVERLEPREVPTVFVPSQIGGRVYVDCDLDGVFDANEEAIAGVTVTLTGTNINGATISVTTTTGVDGSYLFKNLAPGQYTLTETQPGSFFDGKDTLGTIAGAPPASYGVAENDRFHTIQLGASQNGQDYNFGEYEKNTLSGVVYLDLNDNGVQDQGESGIAGATLVLTGTNDLGGAVNQTITSTANGTYSFLDLRPGNYTITETTPPGFADGKDTVGTVDGVFSGNINGNDQIVNITIDGCHSGIGYNFGEKKQSALHSISGFVYHDCDFNGVFNGNDEPISGVVVVLTGTDNSGAAVSINATTNASGFYQIGNLKAGNYTLTEVQPAGYLDNKESAGTPFGGTASTTIGQDTISKIVIPESTVSLQGVNYNFGEVGASISGQIYEDSNGNGVRDGGEALITQPVTVTLTGTDDIGAVISKSIVTSSGEYKFDLLRPGKYSLTETTPLGYVDGGDSVGTPFGGNTQGADSIVNINVDGCNAGVGYNFGEKKAAKATISGFVYEDCNNNGIREVGEEPISGVTITLAGTDSQGNAVLLSTTTGIDGGYKFVDLNPGAYLLTESQPITHLDGKDTAGTPFGGIASPNIGQDFISAIIIPASSGNGVNYNFGEVGSDLTGFVYHDVNDNGVKEAGEAGIAGATVTLTGINDIGQNLSIVTTTGADGSYVFDKLRPGAYKLSETQPANWSDGKESIGNPSGTLSANDVISDIVIDGCTSGIGFNFGEKLPTKATISGFVFEDCTFDGIRDLDEEPIAGVTITLTGTTTQGQAVSLTTTTGADGKYTFSDLAAGTYQLTETQPAAFLDGKDSVGTPFGGTAGAAIGQDAISNIVIPISGGNGVDYNFSEVGSKITGFVYQDMNDNGVFEAGEMPIQGVTVTLTGTNDLGNAVSLTAVTDAAGAYVFDKLRPGQYSLSETQPTGYFDGKDALGTNKGVVLGKLGANDSMTSINVDGCTSGINFNFGECPPASVSGYVYLDTGLGTPGTAGYNDGIKQTNESGIGNVTVTLTGTDNQGNAVSLTTTTRATTVAAERGYYEFTNLRPGTYVISETQPLGLPDGKDTPGTPLGSNAAINDKISNVVLPCGFNGVNNNFGELANQSPPGTAQISGLVYIDADCDGVQDATDTGRIAGVTIFLVNTGTGQTLTTTTDAQGRYSFTDLTEGNYMVIEQQPAGYLDSGEHVGTNFGGSLTNDRISTIVIPPIPDDTTLIGENYNFGECVSDPTKRRFLASARRNP